MNRLFRFLGARLFSNTSAAMTGGNIRSAIAARNNLIGQSALIGLTFLIPGTPQEKMEGLAWNAVGYFATMGMNSPARQFGWSFAIAMTPHFGDLARGFVQGYRGVIEARTSAQVPFSHSNLAMDQAFMSLQYAQRRLSDAYGTTGNEAAFMAARYMSR